MLVNTSIMAAATIATDSNLDFDVRDDPGMINDPAASFGFDLDSILNEEQDDGIPMPSMDEKESTGRWTREEHLLFVRGLELYGKGWKKIAGLIKTRTVVQIRTHAQKYFLKMSKARQSGETGTSRDGKVATQGNKKRRTTPRPSEDFAVAPCLQPFLRLPPPPSLVATGGSGNDAIAPGGNLGLGVSLAGGEDGVSALEDASHIDIDRSLYNFLSAKVTSHIQYNGSLRAHFDGDSHSAVKEYTIPRPDWFRKGLSLEFLLNEAEHINSQLLQESGNNNGGITFGVATTLQLGNTSKSVGDSRFPGNRRISSNISGIPEVLGMSIPSAPASNRTEIVAHRKRAAPVDLAAKSEDANCVSSSIASSTSSSDDVHNSGVPAAISDGTTTASCEGSSELNPPVSPAGARAAPASSVPAALQHSSSTTLSSSSVTAAAPSLLLHQRQAQQAQQGISMQRPMVLQLQPGGGGPRGGQGGLGGAGSHSGHMTQQPASLSLQCLGLATSATSSLSLMPAPPAAHTSGGSVSQQQPQQQQQQQQVIMVKEEVISSPVPHVKLSQSSDMTTTSLLSAPTDPSNSSDRSNASS